MVEKKSKKSQKNIFEHLIGQVGLKIYNLRQAEHLCGHRFVSSTEGYLVNDLDDLSEEIEKYHPI